MLSQTEENYLKGIFHLTLDSGEKTEVGTNELAQHLVVKPATVNDMLKKLKEKKLIHYEKYGKISLSSAGKKRALQIVRKHRLWETFLYEILHFSWDEVHEVAEQLEHIESAKLIAELDKFLGYPSTDPHGDIIPTAQGEMKTIAKSTLSDIAVNKKCKLIAVKNNSASFLQYAVKLGLGLSSTIKVISRQEFDNSTEIEVNGKKSIVSQKFTDNIWVKEL